MGWNECDGDGITHEKTAATTTTTANWFND